MSNLNQKITNHSLFVPRNGKKLSFDYPELSNNKDIKDLSKSEMLFCYFLGCETSPLVQYYEGDNLEHVSLAISKAIEASGIDLSDQEVYQYTNERMFPSRITKGVNAFSRYKTSVRLRAKLMQQKMLDNFEKIVDVDVNGAEFNIVDKEGRDTGEKDYDKVKKYVDAATKISNDLQGIIDKIEYGYGVKEVKSNKKDDSGVSLTDRKHEGEI